MTQRSLWTTENGYPREQILANGYTRKQLLANSYPEAATREQILERSYSRGAMRQSHPTGAIRQNASDRTIRAPEVSMGLSEDRDARVLRENQESRRITSSPRHLVTAWWHHCVIEST